MKCARHRDKPEQVSSDPASCVYPIGGRVTSTGSLTRKALESLADPMQQPAVKSSSSKSNLRRLF